jgi:DNA-binding transcriptional regulator GbsR (MarR family)
VWSYLTNSNKEIREQLHKIEQELTEKFSHIAANFGITGLKQLLISVLFVSVGEARSLTELVNLTGYSKASISRHMRELEKEIPFLLRVKKPQDKEKYYRLNANIMEVLNAFIVKGITEEAEPTIAASEKAVKQLKTLKSIVIDREVSTEIDLFIKRMQYLATTYRKFLWISEKMLFFWDEMEREWEEIHGKSE